MALKSSAMGVLDHGAVVLGCEKWEGEAQDQVWPSDNGLQEGVGGPFLHPLPRLYSGIGIILERKVFGGIESRYQGEKEQTAHEIFDVLPM